MHFSFTYIMRRISFYLIEQYLEAIKSIEMLGSASCTWIHLVMADLLCAPYVASWRSVEVLAVRALFMYLTSFPYLFAFHAYRIVLKAFVTMTVATVLLKATSLVSTLSQLRTNGKLLWFSLRIICVLLAPRETLCLQVLRTGGSNLGTFAAPKLPQFLDNK